jgi:hypothetical protein
MGESGRGERVERAAGRKWKGPKEPKYLFLLAMSQG